MVSFWPPLPLTIIKYFPIFSFKKKWRWQFPEWCYMFCSPWNLLTCALRLLFWEKDFLQILHMKGFSPEWTLLCTINLLADIEEYSHCSHFNGLIPCSFAIWRRREPDFFPAKSHFVHWCGMLAKLLSECATLVCSFRWFAVILVNTHNVHPWGFLLSESSYVFSNWLDQGN